MLSDINTKRITRDALRYMESEGTIDQSRLTYAYHVPKGVLCRISVEDGNIVFTNGTSVIVNCKFAKDIHNAGVSGIIIISNPTINPQAMSKWLHGNLSRDNDISDRVIIYPLIDKDTNIQPTNYRIESINPLRCKYQVAQSINRIYNADMNYDGRIINFNDINGKEYWCHVVPTRHIKATIRYVGRTDYGNQFLIVAASFMGSTYILRVDKFSRKTIDNTFHVDDGIGMNYSSFHMGNLFCNFINPICVARLTENYNA